MKCFQRPKISPRWRKSILQEVTAALAGRLEEFNVAAQPRLQTEAARRAMGEPSRRHPSVRHQSYHEGADDNIRHLGQLIVQQGCGGMVCYLATTQLIRDIGNEMAASISHQLTESEAVMMSV